MIEWLKQLPAKIKELWAKWKPVQKGIFIGIVLLVVVALALMFRVNSAPAGVPLFTTVIRDEDARENITMRLDQENVDFRVREDGLIIVNDKKTAEKMKSILITEGLVPKEVDAFNLFDKSSWSDTDFDRNIKLQRSLTKQLMQHILAIDDIANATVDLTFPKKELFSTDQKPVTASVIVTFKPNSTMPEERKRLKGLQDLILRSVVGLTAENLTLSDNFGNILNDFESLQKNFNGADRVRDLVVKIEKDLNFVSKDQTIYTPVIITEQDPDKPYDTTEKRESITLSSQEIKKTWTGTGYNPEGPAGVEGQNSPVYSDMSNVIGKSTEEGITKNNVVNKEERHTDQNYELKRISASANIDGRWETIIDKNRKPIVINDQNLSEWQSYCQQNEIPLDNCRLSIGHFFRVYHPVSQKVIDDVTKIVQSGINYQKKRGDSVSITSFPIPRDKEWEIEEDAYFRKEETRRTVLFSLAGITVILLAFIVFRFISRELDRRRRLREEEILRRQQAEREKALWDAKQDGLQDVTMSVEERKRAELQENAIAMAKEHPEDVAMLIRTWLLEE